MKNIDRLLKIVIFQVFQIVVVIFNDSTFFQIRLIL